MPRLDHLTLTQSWLSLPDTLWAKVTPQGLAAPRLVSFNADAAALLGLDPDEAHSEAFLAFASGNRVLPGSTPLAQKYTGHQFGVYNPDLGDGRGLLLTEVRNAQGESWDLHLKGAGTTPYSRGADGRAVLRSTIREYLGSEAMHGLGIPTTRALCVVAGQDRVMREEPETSATLIRLAETHVRFGHFEYLFYTQQHTRLAQLADYVIDRHFPAYSGQPDRHAFFLRDVVARTARLVAHWQAVGFNHGVMNTDNMSILGLTFDYGPYAFFDDYDANFICNHSDYNGRYAFSRQPQIALWNLNALAHALSPLVPREQLVELLQGYEGILLETWLGLMRAKCGLRGERAGDAELLQELIGLLHESHVDYPSFFRALCTLDPSAGTHNALRDSIINRERFDAWSTTWGERLQTEQGDSSERRIRMQRVNPKYVLRNWLLQVAIDKARTGDDSEVNLLLKVVQKPYDEWPEHERLAALPPDWGKRMEISCSS